MKNKVIKLMICICMMCIVTVCNLQNIKAAHYVVNVTDNGDESITVTVSSNSVAGGLNVLINGEVRGTLKLITIGNSDSIVLKTGAGSFNVAVQSISLADKEYNIYEDEVVSTNILVKSQNHSENNSKPQEKPQIQDNLEENEPEDKRNTDSALKSLSVSVGTLQPSFDPKVTSYKVNVDGNTKSINVKATARDAKAGVDGVGNHDLKVGNNTIYVSGVAENGTITTYKIKVHVDEKPLVFLTYNGDKMGVSRVPLEMESKLFEGKTIKIDGKNVKVLKNDALNITLVTLEKNGKKDFYIYDEQKNKVVSIYRPMALCGENIAMIDVPKELQKRNGMKFTKVKVDKVELDGWTFDDPEFKNYALIYVMNDAGKKVYYQYEKTENTLQLYNEGAPITQKKYEKSIHEYEGEVNDLKMIVYGLIGISVVLGIGLIAVSIKKKKTKKYQKIDTMNKDLSKSSKIEKSAFMVEDNEGDNL